MQSSAYCVASGKVLWISSSNQSVGGTSGSKRWRASWKAKRAVAW